MDGAGNPPRHGEPHVIRLRAEWELERHVDRVVLLRRFGRPSGLTPRHAVRLVLEGDLAIHGTTLNDLPLAATVAGAGGESGVRVYGYDITGRLGQRNVLRLTAGQTCDGGGRVVAAGSVETGLVLPVNAGGLRVTQARLEISTR